MAILPYYTWSQRIRVILRRLRRLRRIFLKNLKKKTLKENFSLGYLINFKRINLSWLISGKYFIVPYTVSRNKYRVNTTTLINTRVNSFAFINTAYIINTAKFLNIKAT